MSLPVIIMRARQNDKVVCWEHQQAQDGEVGAAVSWRPVKVVPCNEGSGRKHELTTQLDDEVQPE